jgi:hypothetical protein
MTDIHLALPTRKPDCLESSSYLLTFGKSRPRELHLNSCFTFLQTRSNGQEAYKAKRWRKPKDEGSTWCICGLILGLAYCFFEIKIGCSWFQSDGCGVYKNIVVFFKVISWWDSDKKIRYVIYTCLGLLPKSCMRMR